MADRKRAYQTGIDAEDEAARFLQAQGFDEIARRAKMPGGEIDLIVEDAQTLIFVEVKARAKLTDGVEAVSGRQQGRIRAGLRAWLAKHDSQGERCSTKSVRCDVVVVAPGHDPLHIPNAFPAADESGF
ncbi:MAG: YraN family protein [Devosiaceae bacterium]